MSDKIVVLVDGHCSLCKGWTYFAARRDSEDNLRFGSQQSDAGRSLLEDLGYHDLIGESVLVVRGGTPYKRSRAVFEVLRVLRWPWPVLAYAWYVIPWFLRDALYWVVARYRSALFGEEDDDFCERPVGELSQKLFR